MRRHLRSSINWIRRSARRWRRQFFAWVICTIAIAASLLVVVPSVSVNYVDWSHPNHVRWAEKDGVKVVDKHGKGTPEVDYADSAETNLEHFYDKAGISWWQPDFLQIIGVSLGLGLLCLLLIGIYQLTFPGYKPDAILIAVGVSQALLWLLCFGIGIVLATGGGIKAGISSVTTDPELIKQASKLADTYIGSRGAVSIFLSVGSLLALDAVVLFSAGLANSILEGLSDSLWRILSRHAPYYLNHQTVISIGRETVSIHNLSVQRHFGFIPVLEGRLANEVSFRRFFDLLTNGSRKDVAYQLRSRVNTALIDRRGEIRPDTISQLASHISSESSRNLLPQLTESMQSSGSSLTEARQMLQEASNNTLVRYQRDMVTGIRIVADDALSAFRRTVREKLSDSILGGVMTPNSIGTGDILPNGVRFISDQGETTIVVVEEKPKVRTVLFGQSFLDDEGIRLRGREELQLAFPYVVFVMAFNHGHLASLYTYYRTEPLGNLEDTLCIPNLTNIGSRGDVCLGRPEVNHQATLANKVEAVISHFWQSEFNLDLSDNYNRYRSQDSRLGSLSAWERASSADPLFVLGVRWESASWTLAQLIRRLGEDGVRDVLGRVDEAIHTAFDAGLEEMSRVIESYCAGIKVVNRYPRLTENQLAKYLQDLRSRLQQSYSENLTTLLSNENRLTDSLLQELYYAIDNILGDEVEQFLETADFIPTVDPRELTHELSRLRG